ncbi:MAG: cbb3-type cytochrome c oxidase N-terminal domain-containing protein [Planctomycetota bacterium]|nr:cbb3-type cytochrome c oxidase N-terminal domain-containing protein [Planctomycetota bacterium]
MPLKDHAMSTREELLDHEYDGIREYDNPVPGWWHAIFWATILFCVPYAFFFHFSPAGWSVHEAYEAEMAAFYRAKFSKFGDLAADNETIIGLAKNTEYMSAVKGTFQGKCAACHAKDGAGLVGPNLTDEAFINVEVPTDIYTIISEGVPAKGMPAWGRLLHPNEVVLLSAYVASLRGEDLPGKPPEGEPAPEWPDAPRLDFEEPTEG